MALTQALPACVAMAATTRPNPLFMTIRTEPLDA